MSGERLCHGRGSNAVEACDTLTSQRKEWYATYGVWNDTVSIIFAGVSGINHECVFLKLQQQYLRSHAFVSKTSHVDINR